MYCELRELGPLRFFFATASDEGTAAAATTL
jgi:hypothetical protein